MHKTILPSARILPTHGDAAHLAEEILAGSVNAAAITLPLEHPDLHVEGLRRDRLVVCLRKDDPLPPRPLFNQGVCRTTSPSFTIRNATATHDRSLELLAHAGVLVDELFPRIPSDRDADARKGRVPLPLDP
jgi:DNA-binding transcriptional LysR family regulator